MVNMTNMIKDVCGCCNKNILIGQRFIECYNCLKIVHYNCRKTSNFNFKLHNSMPLCPDCITTIPQRYNPYRECENITCDIDVDGSEHFYNVNFSEEISSFHKANQILESCKNQNSNFLEINHHTSADSDF